MKVSQQKNTDLPAPKNSPNSSLNQLSLGNQFQPPLPSRESGDSKNFAGILDEIRSSSRRENRREDETKETRQSFKSEKETETERSDERVTEKKEKQDDDSNSDSKNGDQQNPNAFVNLNQLFPPNVWSNSDAPNARSILHIADVERIVSAFRSQVSNGQANISIQLKNSVLEGLQINLTSENGKLTAELIASSEHVKKQLDARAAELAEILRSRGLNLSKLSISMGANSSGKQGSQNFLKENSKQISGLVGKNKTSQVVNETEVAEDETTYRI